MKKMSWAMAKTVVCRIIVLIWVGSKFQSLVMATKRRPRPSLTMKSRHVDDDLSRSTVSTYHWGSVVQCYERRQTSVHRACIWCVSRLAANAVFVAVVWQGQKQVHDKLDVQRCVGFVADVGVQSHHCLQTVRCSSLNVTWRRRGSTVSLEVYREIAERLWCDVDDTCSSSVERLRTSSGMRVECQLFIDVHIKVVTASCRRWKRANDARTITLI